MLTREIAPWVDYALLDSGQGEKLERFGDIIMIRPDPQAIWPREGRKEWEDAHLTYKRQGREGEWLMKHEVPPVWTMGWEDLVFRIRPTSFKHTGLFPEQASNWQWLRQHLKPGMKVLNLFGYTGGASLAAASVDCDVTHVDASKPVVTWGRENLEAANLQEKKVRWIVDDAQKFVAREIRRDSKYDAILMDPPAFGRGPEGEVWQFAEHLSPLLAGCQQLLKKESGILLVNAYSLGFPALALENLIKNIVPHAVITSAELTLQEQTKRQFLLPTGVVVRATW